MASQAASQQHVQSTHPFICNTCQVAFRSGDLQRAHMQTDWHRYNLKRRVASLPPLSSEIFTEKVLANKASAAATAAKASFEKSCQACQKMYYSENAYNNHLNSSKHKNNANKAGRGVLEDSASVTGSVMSSALSLGEPLADADTEKDFSEVVESMKDAKLESSASEPVSPQPSRPAHSITGNGPEMAQAGQDDDKNSVASSTRPPTNPLTDCLFCNYRSPTFSLNMHHMGRHHGMFVPEKEFLVEPESLIKYLHRKINKYHQCLKCNKLVHTTAGIQTHMRDRGHCMIGFEDDAQLVEIGQFYDFRSSYPDADHFQEIEREAEESDDTQSTADGGVKLGARRKTVVDTATSGDEGDEGWETDSTVSSVPTDEITSVPIDDRSHRYKLLAQSRHHSHSDPRPHRSVDGYHSHAHATPVAVYHDEYELHLPTGRTAGHRSLSKYYRQNLRNYPGVAERMESQRMITTATTDSDGDVDMDGPRQQSNNRGRQLVSRANGGLGMIGVSDTKKGEVRAAEKRERNKEHRERVKHEALVQKRGNKQKHFRDPLLQ